MDATSDIRRDNYEQMLDAVIDGRVVMDARPVEVHLALTNACNLRCPFCPYLGLSYKKPHSHEFMSMDVVKKIVPFFATARFGNPCGRGEIFLYPHFDEFIQLARDTDFLRVCQLTTNGTLLHRHDLSALRETCIISVSVDGATKELFEYLRHGASFNQVMDNMDRLRATLPENTLQICTEINRLNIDEIFSIYSLAREKEFNVIAFNAIYGADSDPVIQHLRLRDADESAYRAQMDRVHADNHDKRMFIYDLPVFSGFEDGELRNPPAIRAALDAMANHKPTLDYDADLPPKWHNGHAITYASPKKDFGKTPYCMMPFTTFFALGNGGVAPCSCGVPPCDSITNEPVEAVWNGDAFRHIRAAMLGKAPLPDTCRRCRSFVRYAYVDDLLARRRARGLSDESLSIPMGYNPPADILKDTSFRQRIAAINIVGGMDSAATPHLSPTTPSSTTNPKDSESPQIAPFKVDLREVRFRTISLCTLRCVHCVQGAKNVPPAVMSDMVFERAVDDLAAVDYRGRLCFSEGNEPLLDPRIPEFVRRAAERLPRTRRILYTNGDLASKTVFRRLFDAGLDSIFISLHHTRRAEALKELADHFGALRVSILDYLPKSSNTSPGATEPVLADIANLRRASILSIQIIQPAVAALDARRWRTLSAIKRVTNRVERRIVVETRHDGLLRIHRQGELPRHVDAA